MAGLRNILVHMYAHVDREKILECSKTLIKDVTNISSRILNAMKGREVDPADPARYPGDKDLREIIERLREVLKGRVRIAYLFGSRARGYEIRGDYDIAVLMPEDHSLYDLGLLQVEIARALGVDEEKVDLICLNSSSPELVLEALNGVSIIDDPLEAFKLRLKALMVFLDVKEALAAISK